MDVKTFAQAGTVPEWIQAVSAITLGIPTLIYLRKAYLAAKEQALAAKAQAAAAVAQTNAAEEAAFQASEQNLLTREQIQNAMTPILVIVVERRTDGGSKYAVENQGPGVAYSIKVQAKFPDKRVEDIQLSSDTLGSGFRAALSIGNNAYGVTCTATIKCADETTQGYTVVAQIENTTITHVSRTFE